MKPTKKSLIFIPIAVLLAVVFSLGLSEPTADRLWILCDFSMKSSPTIGTSYVNDEIYNLNRCLKVGLGLSEDEFEIEFLPTDKTEREARITALRVQIMAGGGPDVFILSGNIPGWDNLPHWEYENSNYDFLDEVSENYGNQQRLFSDVQSAMQSGLFLPLDDYIDNAEWLDPNVINPVVWQACGNEQGQMIVPLTISFPIAVYDGNIFDENFAEPQNWTEGITSSSEDIRAAYLASARRQFSDLFGDLADYENEQLLFTEQELLETVFAVLEQKEQNILDLVDEGGILSEEKYGSLLTLTLANHDDLRVLWSPYLNELTGCAEERLTDLRFTTIYNKNGGVTANIDSFIAINRNTGNSDLAFSVVDFLSSTEILNGLGGTETSDELGMQAYQTFYALAAHGVPARDDLMNPSKRSEDLGFVQGYVPNEEIWSKYSAARGEITSARVYGQLDVELQSMFEKCAVAESDEEIAEIVSSAYRTMEIELGE